MIIGHQRILEFLKESIKNKKLAHAYLFAGPAHLGKKRVALEFIKMLNGREVIEPEAADQIGINQVRKIQHQIGLSLYRGNYKIALIDEADRMTPEASNCLLKTLEEPPGRAILILITSKSQMLLPTIVSRCQIIKFLPVKEEEIKKKVSSLKIVRLANGRPGLAIQYLENPTLLENQNKIISQLEKLIRAGLNERYQYIEGMIKDIAQARQILNAWKFWFRDLLLLSVGCGDLVIYPEANRYKDCYSLVKLKAIIQAIRKTDLLLANPSINARLALEVLMLEL